MMSALIDAAEWLSRTLWALSWQAGMLVLIIWAASLIFRKAAPNFRYWLWCIVLLRLCIPATLALPWGVSGEIRHAVEISAPQVLLAAQQTAPFSQPSPLAAIDSAPSPVGEPLLSMSTPDVMRDAMPGLSVAAKLGFGWMSVSLFLLAVVAMRNLRARRMLRRLPEITRPELLQLANSLRSACAIRRPVGVRTLAAGQAAYGPAVVGVMSPTILLPLQITEQWSLDEIEPVLLHEFAHIKRWDLLFNWVQMFMQAVYFFHPLVWFANARIREERELACDDLAVLLLRGQSKRYSRSFVRVIEDASHERPAFHLAGVGMTERQKPLARRIVRMMGKDYRLYRPLGWLSISLLLFVSVAAMAMAAERATDAGQAAPDSVAAGTQPAKPATPPHPDIEGPTGKASLSGKVFEDSWWSGKSVAGATVALQQPYSADIIQAPVSDDGSFEFKNIPGGTYSIAVKPLGCESISPSKIQWRLIDLGDEEIKARVMLRLHHNETDKNDTMHYLDVPQLNAGTLTGRLLQGALQALDAPQLSIEPTWSSLPANLRRQAEAAFASQHDNWLSIRRLSANYRWTAKLMEKGEWKENPPRTGTVAYELIPITLEEARKMGNYVRMQLRWRVYDNELKWNAASDNIVSGDRRTMYWEEGHESERSSTSPKQPMLPTHLFSEIPSGMAMSYGDAHWDGSRFTRNQWFKQITPVIRLSTSEETEQILGGERCYMFFEFLSQPRLWISAETGKIYQFDMWEEGRARTYTTRYEDYIEDPDSKLSFPSRLTSSWIEGEGVDKKGHEDTIELSDIHINPDLPPETFQTK